MKSRARKDLPLAHQRLKTAMLTVIKIDEIENKWLSQTQKSDPNLFFLIAKFLRVKLLRRSMMLNLNPLYSLANKSKKALNIMNGKEH